jgi:hypothetical protein
VSGTGSCTRPVLRVVCYLLGPNKVLPECFLPLSFVPLPTVYFSLQILETRINKELRFRTARLSCLCLCLSHSVCLSLSLSLSPSLCLSLSQTHTHSALSSILVDLCEMIGRTWPTAVTHLPLSLSLSLSSGFSLLSSHQAPFPSLVGIS